jgi:hypothetical protein
VKSGGGKTRKYQNGFSRTSRVAAAPNLWNLFPEKQVLASWMRGGLPLFESTCALLRATACYQVVSAQNGHKRGPRTMATGSSPSPRSGRGLVVAMAEFPTAFRPHTISGQNVQKRRLPGSVRRLDRVDGFLEFFTRLRGSHRHCAFSEVQTD